MPPTLDRKFIRPTKPTFDPEEIRRQADALFCAVKSQDLRDVVTQKIQELEYYDVQAMERVAAICFFAKSGSILLASYLDGHDDVLGLPALSGTDIYKFFERFPSLSLREKLICYAAHVEHFAPLFEGDFAISPAQYYAAVEAIVEFYAKWPAEFLESRRTFFLLVHIAYNMAVGRRPANSRPLIVYQQHFWDPAMAGRLVDDFPQAKFIHTVRDPITSCGQMLAERLLPTEPLPDESNSVEPGVDMRGKSPVAKGLLMRAARRVASPFEKLAGLLRRRHFHLLSPINGDRAHFGMEARTRGIRFEDLHCDTAETMRDLSDWLGLSYQASLLESTFNGIPWVVTRGGKTWSGRRPEQAQRNPRYISPKDQALLFALFHENFVDWNYPYPKIFRHAIVRCVVFCALFAFPMKIEFTAARARWKTTILPALGRGNISIAISSLLRIVFCRLTILTLFALEFIGRCLHEKRLLELGHAGSPAGAPRNDWNMGDLGKHGV